MPVRAGDGLNMSTVGAVAAKITATRNLQILFP
jgi:hypothetical protein